MINQTTLKKIGDKELITNFRGQLICLYDDDFNKAIGSIGGLVKNGVIVCIKEDDKDYFLRVK